MDCSLPGSSVHGILQERILEWVAVPSTREFPDPEIERVSLMSLALADGFFTTSITWEALETHVGTSISLLGGEQQGSPGDSSEAGGGKPRGHTAKLVGSGHSLHTATCDRCLGHITGTGAQLQSLCTYSTREERAT